MMGLFRLCEPQTFSTVLTRVVQIGSRIIVLHLLKVRKVGGAAAAGVVDVADKPYTGSCLCGAVSYRAVGLSDIWYCHCNQCQKLTGLYIAAAGVQRDNLEIEGDVNWLPISDKSQSGHCKSCGSYMFWNSHSFDTISILAGSIDETEGLSVKGHIYTSEKADYYEITDGLPQYDIYPPDGTRPQEVLK